MGAESAELQRVFGFYPPKLGDDGDGDDGEDGGKGCESGENDEQARMCGRPTRRCKSDDDDVYGVLHGARGIDRAKSEMFSSLGSLRGSESADSREKDGTVDTETSREKVEERDAFVRRMLEKSKEKRGKSKGLEKRGKNEKWRRKFYSSQWFEEDSALEESESVVEAKEFLEETRITSGSNDKSEVKLESLESFPIPRTKGLRRVFSARDLAF